MGYHQKTQSNYAYYYRFNTKCDVADAIGINLGDHSILNERVTQEDHTGDDFEDLTDVQKLAVRKKSKDKYLVYMMVQQSNSSSAKLRSSLSDAYELGDEKYPANRQAEFHFLESSTRKLSDNQLSHMKAVLLPRKENNKNRSQVIRLTPRIGTKRRNVRT